MKTNHFQKNISFFIKISFTLVKILFCFLPLSALCQSTDVVSIPLTNRYVKVRGAGNVHIKLTKQRIFNSNSSAKYFQGYVKIGRNTFPTAANQINNTLSITFPGRVTGSRKSRQRLYTVKYSNKNIRIASVPSSAMSHKNCAEEDSHIVRATTEHTKPVSAQQLESIKIVTVSTYADVEWRQIYGDNSNAQILAIINEAEAIYNNQLGIRFRVFSQEIFDSNIETSPGKILSNFRNTITGTTTANIKHLFTGKDMDGTTIGIAYIGAVCYSPEYAFGVTQNYGVLTSNIFAHEVGHNLNAQHDYAGYGTLMYPSISFGSVQFSDSSLSQINSFLSYFGSCLSTELLPPSLNNSKLVITHKKHFVYITLLSENGVPIENQEISYRIGKSKLSKKITNPQGFVRIKINKKGVYTIKAFLSSDANIITSKKIVIK